jgi:hypothetical protein
MLYELSSELLVLSYTSFMGSNIVRNTQVKAESVTVLYLVSFRFEHKEYTNSFPYTFHFAYF